MGQSRRHADQDEAVKVRPSTEACPYDPPRVRAAFCRAPRLLVVPASRLDAGARPHRRWWSRRTTSPPKSASRSSRAAATPSTPRWPPPLRWPSRIRRPATSAAAASSSSGRRRASRRRSTSAKRRRPARIAEMWLKNGKYDFDLHHNSHRAVGVPGTVAGLAPGVEDARQQAVEGPGRAGGQAGARRLRGQRRPGALARAACSTDVQEVSRVARAVLEERHAVPGRRDPEAARSRAHARAHRRPGARPGSTRARPRCSSRRR